MACQFYRPVMDRSHMRNIAPCGDYLSCRITAVTFPTGNPMELSFSSHGAFTVLYPRDTRAQISYLPTVNLSAVLVLDGCKIRA